ncbi:hypothetical protein Bca4012_093552 [Brassica carinata]
MYGEVTKVNLQNGSQRRNLFTEDKTQTHQQLFKLAGIAQLGERQTEDLKLVMRVWSISTERAKNILALSRTLTSRSMLGSLGHRPAGRSRDFTWVQALGFLVNSQKFSLEATKVATWDDSIDHLRFSFDGQDLIIPKEILSTWYSPKKDIKIRRATKMNSVTVTIKDKAEIMVNVVPVTKEDDRIQSYKVPSDDCLAHLEVQFRFLNLSPRVDGILGRTSRPGFQNQAKSGAAIPVIGGEDKFRTTSLLSHDCKTCIFTGLSSSIKWETEHAVLDLDCTRGASFGYGIICRSRK